MYFRPVNPFPSIQKYVDLKKYKEFINEWIDNGYNNYLYQIKCLSISRVKSTFWALVKNEKEYNSSSWYDFFSVTILRTISFDILKKEHRIEDESLITHRMWFRYLMERIIPHQNSISDDFYQKLYSDQILGEFERAFQVVKNGLSIIAEYNIIDVLWDVNIDNTTKLRKFKESYENAYAIFLNYCSYFGFELSKYEGNHKKGRWGDRIHEIFYLHSNHPNRPPELIEQNLDLLRHVRNSFVHNDYLISGNEVTFRDRDWSRKFKMNTLWKIHHRLYLMGREFCTISLWAYSLRWIFRYTHLYCKPVICHKCNQIDYYIITAYTRFIICKHCKWFHFCKDLLITDSSNFRKAKKKD